jgi:MoaA/NifB/PqqE/SkfB family radical SAM enzyme
LDSFKRERAEVIAESVRLGLLGGSDEERRFTTGCAKCANFLEGDYGKSDGLIHYVNLSMYPAPCQCKCIYCDVHSGESGAFNKRLHADCYEKLFDLLDHARKSGLIAQDAVWQVSSGEIAIHLYKDRILDLVKNQVAVFYTNCFIFDEKIAESLKANPNSSINLSIDAGTPKTWHRIKGVDNFETVTMNLVKYFNSSSRPGQITLKYIILPGVNDSLEDFASVIEIMKILKTGQLSIARDTRKKYTLGEEQTEILIRAAGYLAAMLHKNGLTINAFTYAPAERERIGEFATELLQSGIV